MPRRTETQGWHTSLHAGSGRSLLLQHPQREAAPRGCCGWVCALNAELCGQPKPCCRPASPSRTPAPTFPTRPAAQAPAEVTGVFDVPVCFTRQARAGAVLLFTVLRHVGACKKGWTGGEEEEERAYQWLYSTGWGCPCSKSWFCCKVVCCDVFSGCLRPSYLRGTACNTNRCPGPGKSLPLSCLAPRDPPCPS